MTDLTVVLTDSPLEASQAWEEMEKDKLAEEQAFSRAFLKHKAQLKEEGMAPSPAADEAKHLANQDEEYESAYLKRITSEARYRRLNDTQTNSRRLADLARGGL